MNAVARSTTARRAPRARRWPQAIFALALAAIPAIGAAHPFGDRYAAQRLDVRLDLGGVDVAFMADAPMALLPPGTPDTPEGLEEAARGLSAGLILTVDGATVPLRVTSQQARLDLVSMHTRVLELVLRADISLQGPHTVAVSNGNLQGAPSFFLSTLEVAPSITILDSSLLTGTEAEQSLSGRWTRSEGRRLMHAELDGDGSLPARALTSLDPRTVDLHTAHAPPVASWRAGGHTARNAGLLLLLGLAAGAGLGVAAPRERRTMGALLIAVAIPWLPQGPPLPAALSGCALLVAAWTLRTRLAPLAIPVGVAVVGVIGGPWGTATQVTLLAGALLGLAPPRRESAAVWVVAATALLLATWASTGLP
jgi:hypothetical protein